MQTDQPRSTTLPDPSPISRRRAGGRRASLAVWSLLVGLLLAATPPATAAPRPATPTQTLPVTPIQIDNGTVSSSPSPVVDVAGTGYLVADVVPPVRNDCASCGAQETRRGLYRTDGTEAGTTLVTVAKAPIDAHSLRAAGDRLFFTLASDDATPTDRDGRKVREGLWTSDGTEAGTRRVWPAAGADVPEVRIVAATPTRVLFFAFPDDIKGYGGPSQGTLLSIAPGEAEPATLWSGTLRVDDLASALAPPHTTGDGTLFLRLPATPGGGLDLWRSDGTTAGTRPTNVPGVNLLIAAAGSTLYLSIGGKIVRSDGTPGGTSPVAADYPAGATFDERAGIAAAMVGDRLVFIATSNGPGTSGVVWSTDGTQTRQLSRAIPAAVGSHTVRSPKGLVATGDRAFYLNPDSRGIEQVWSTDGIGEPVQLTRARDDARDGIRHLSVAGGAAYFQLGSTLLTSDGTVTGTRPLHTGIAVLTENQTAFRASGGRVFFAGTDPVAGIEPWVTDGTPQGTHLLKDLLTAPYGYYDPGPRWPVELGGAAIFPRRGPVPSLWRSDGTSEGTRRLAFLPQELTGRLVRSGPYAYFRLQSYLGVGIEVWRTDGTPSGTIPLTGEGLPVLEDLSPLPGGGALFTGPASAGAAGVGRRALWATDGSPGSARPLLDLPAGSHVRRALGPRNERFVAAGRYAYFTLSRTKGEGALWRTDGTAAGTRAVAGIRGQLSAAVAIRGRLWLASPAAGAGAQLWSTDGTARGTRRETSRRLRGDGLGRVHEIAVGPGGRVVFSARSGGASAVWTTSGGPGGVTRLATVDQPARQLVTVGRRVTFTVSTGFTHHQLWATDGTRVGTRQLRAFRSGSLSRGFTIDGRRYFDTGGDESFSGDPSQLWRTDGTVRGTRRFRIEVAGRPALFASDLMHAGRTLLFSMRAPDGFQFGSAGVR